MEAEEINAKVRAPPFLKLFLETARTPPLSIGDLATITCLELISHA